MTDPRFRFEDGEAEADTIPDPFDEDERKLWSCSDEACGQHPDIGDSRWRWTGERWQHHHGYPTGHVDTVRKDTV